MACNAHNHPPDCNCGWGGQWHGNLAGGRNSLGGDRARSRPTAYEIVSPEVGWSFCIPNAKCPVCGEIVFFYSNSYGSRVFFDDLGPPWPKHPCTDNRQIPSYSFSDILIRSNRHRYSREKQKLRPIEKSGWKHFKVLLTASFRLEIEHIGSGKKFETDIIKKELVNIGLSIWIRKNSESKIELNYFDSDAMRPIYKEYSYVNARKYATMFDWEPFNVWFNSI